MENKDELARYLYWSIQHDGLNDEYCILHYLEEFEEGWRVDEDETHFIRPDGELLRIVK